MPDQTDKFRKLASDCEAIARTATDPATRVFLLTMAQRWHDLANGPAANLDALERDIAMTADEQPPQPIMQQQQQIQDKEG